MLMGVRRGCGRVARSVANFNQGESELMTSVDKQQITIVSTTMATVVTELGAFQIPLM